MQKAYDIAAVVGEYEKDGETKAEWKNVGVIMKNDEGKPFILLDRTFNPAGMPNPENKKNCLLSLFTPKKKEEPADDGAGQI